MGCSQGMPSEASPVTTGTPAHAVPSKTNKQEKLLDKYTLGKVLGQGAFGVVYSCKKKGTKEEYAVKMIDQVETPVAEIKQEVEALKKLEHPCVVKLHDVYYEKVFVCMVLEIYRGGDMIEGMQLHWKSKGMIPMTACQSMSKMMMSSVAWLHQNNVVHRDLKGDNYLQDFKELENPACRIYLSDFGTVVDCAPGTRLKSRCGTKTYWAPEFYAMNYSIKVDIWALGVVIFGLITGRFPFKGEDDVKEKKVKCPSRLGKDGEDFVLKLLDTNENRRITAADAMEHPWLAKIKTAAEKEAEEKLDPTFKGEIKEQGANAGVKERRRELVERLENAQAQHGASQKATMDQLTKGFDVVDSRQETTYKFEWWTPEKVKAAKFYDESKAQTLSEEDVASNEQASEPGIRQMLQSHNIDTTQFGKGQAKSFSEFVHEVQSGQARLMLDAQKWKCIVRVVDVVLLRIVYEDPSGEKKFLIKSKEKYPDGRVRQDIFQLAGTKKLPHENGVQCAHRLVKSRMATFQGLIDIDYHLKESFEDDEDSPSYPGVRTVYRKEIYEARVTTTDQGKLAKLGLGPSGEYSEEDGKKYTRFFVWLDNKQCEAKQVKLRAPTEGAEVSALVSPPIGYEEEELQAFLQASSVDVSQFGKDGVKSLAEFSEELVKGEATLQKQADGTLIRVVDVVILKIYNFEGNTLVEVAQETAGGVKKDTRRLPAAKRREDENPFWAAHRVLNRVLKISENLVEMDEKKVQLVEEKSVSKAYASLPTLYRRRFIPASVVKLA